MRPQLSGVGWGLVFLIFGLRALAHDPGLSSVTISFRSNLVEVVTALADGDFRGLDAKLREGYLRTSREDASEPHPLDRLTLNGMSLVSSECRVSQNRNGDYERRINYLYPRDNFGVVGSTNVFRFESFLIEHLGVGHRQVATLVGENGQSIEQKLLGRADRVMASSWQEMSDRPTVISTMWGFIGLGIHHIATGYDHLLFLAILLLVCPSVRAALLLVTTFTVAHSLTLGVATLGIVRLPGSVVEPLIAASIVYAALENLWKRKFDSTRVAMVFCFGLIHGFGFASVLEDLSIGSGVAIVRPLLGFNLGVELGQLGAVLLVLPILLALRNRPQYLHRWMPIGSVMGATMGAYWFIARVMEG